MFLIGEESGGGVCMCVCVCVSGGMEAVGIKNIAD